MKSMPFLRNRRVLLIMDRRMGWIDQAMKLPRTRNSLPKPGDADRVP